MNISRRIAAHFDDEIRFLKAWMHGPKNIGAIMPTSMVVARSMASVINPNSGLPVLELGPGTGVITRAILARGVKPANLVSVEYSPAFLSALRMDYPGVNFIHGDAFDLDDTLGDLASVQFDSVVSSLPLLNFPVHERIALIEDLLERIPDGRPIVQFSYGPSSPVPAQRGRFEVVHHDFVMRNLPPARVWLYRR